MRRWAGCRDGCFSQQSEMEKSRKKSKKQQHWMKKQRFLQREWTEKAKWKQSGRNYTVLDVVQQARR